ncbi:hypothetical protein BD410DRAFT_847188 [Rickenella mellea]|uniref:Uncharacterized protein n=1 Tax=Rickenella mellea TaxID=50990 RepID=A0A4Y7PFT2_9AGAM|nr:hypothetical protein BD410DRAFT_847188 [Rickenella mellea]
MGARHARVLGWAKSFTKNLEQAEMVQQDNDVIAAAGITWSLIKSCMPNIATRNVDPGTGFQFNLDGKEYSFPLEERSPPEAYMACGYVAWSHKDDAYAKYAFSFNVSQTTNTAPRSGPSTRAATKLAAQQSSSNVPANGGANFVDTSLKVVVRAALGTIFAFKPDLYHGTTVARGILNHNILVTFSKRLADAMTDAVQRPGFMSAPGAGEGNPDNDSE